MSYSDERVQDEVDHANSFFASCKNISEIGDVVNADNFIVESEKSHSLKIVNRVKYDYVEKISDYLFNVTGGIRSRL